MVGIYEK